MRWKKRFNYIFIPFSFIYFVITSLRNFFYNRHILKEARLDARVISVGNITWGGTGKTPAVLFILEALLKRRSKVAVLIRGYGNDEEKLLSNLAPGVPVLVGRDRLRNCLEAIRKYSIDTVLLDDGFQYRRLKRDLDILCIDATNPFANGWVMPSGSMREGFSALKRADIFLITRVDLVEDRANLQNLETKLKRINANALIVKSIHRAQHFYRLSDSKIVDIGQVKGKNITLVSAIGNPDSFEKIVLKLGLKFKKHFIFRDHHWYRKKDLEDIENFCRKNEIDTIIITEKDAIKLQAGDCHLSAVKLLVLSIKLEIIENEQGFFNRLFWIYNSQDI